MIALSLEGKEFTLEPKGCNGLYNDEPLPVEGLSVEALLEFAAGFEGVTFEKAYYKDECEGHEAPQRAKKELVPYWEGHFYLFTKKQKAIMSNVSREYVGKSFSALVKEGLIDDSYVVSFIICPICGQYQIQVDQLDM